MVLPANFARRYCPSKPVDVGPTGCDLGPLDLVVDAFGFDLQVPDLRRRASAAPARVQKAKVSTGYELSRLWIGARPPQHRHPPSPWSSPQTWPGDTAPRTLSAGFIV